MDRRLLERVSALWDNHAIRVMALCVAVCSELGFIETARAGWTTFSNADGLHVGDPHAVVQDHDENMWLGGQGLARYNGRHFTNFNNNDAVGLETVRALLVDRDNTLWVGTEVGLILFDHGVWKTPIPAPALSANRVTSLLQDSRGTIWVGTIAGLSALEGGVWRTYVPGAPTGTIVSVVEGSGGAVWVATARTVARFDGSQWHWFTPGGSPITGLTVDSNGTTWISTDGSGLMRLNQDATWTQVRNPEGGLFDRILDIRGDPGGVLWIAAVGSVGTYHPAGNSWHMYDSSDGAPSSGADFVYRSGDGAVWFGSYYAGFFRFDGTSWQYFPLQSEGGTGFAQALAEDPQTGAIWCGTFWGGLHRYDGVTWRYFGSQYGFPGGNPSVPGSHENVLALHADRTGHVWVGTAEHGVGYFPSPDSMFHFFAGSQGSYRVNCIFEDDSVGVNAIWLGTERGVRRLNLRDSTWTAFDSTTLGYLGEVKSILRDRASGDLWIATASYGIHIRRGDIWEHLIGPPIPSNSISKVIQATNGDIWIGTADGGVVRRSSDQWTVYTTSNGLLNNRVEDIAEDSRGGIWVAHGGSSRYFDGEWGGQFPGGEFANPTDIFSTRGGELWFAHLNGISRHAPDYVAPKTMISTLPPVTSASTTQTIVFTVGYKESLGGVLYSYSLNGASWSDWSLDPFWIDSTLTDNQPGQPHRLTVRARDVIGNVDSTPAAVVFEIDSSPPSPVLTTPVAASLVNGLAVVRDVVELTGTSTDSRFRHSRIQLYRAGVRPGLPLAQDPALDSLPPVIAGPLATWDTRRVEDDMYDVELVVTDSLGLTGSARIRVIVDNTYPPAVVTAPANVVTSKGGDIYTSDGRLHLYFAPRSFPSDVTVAIDPVPSDSVPPELPNGALVVGPSFEINWDHSIALPKGKPARAAISLTNLALPPGAPAVYRLSNEGETWQRVGGSVQKGALLVPILGPGRYAVYVDSGSAGEELSTITFTPRVFSPTGGFADREVGIGFSLPRAAATSVRIFNRGGRLVREVVRSQMLAPGANLVPWDGHDDDGRVVHDGIYIVTIEALGRTVKRTLAVVR